MEPSVQGRPRLLPLKRYIFAAALGFPIFLHPCFGQMDTTSPAPMDALNKVLAQQIQGTDVTAFQLQQYLSHRITPLPSPGTTAEWTTREQELRKHVLKNIAFHGWPQAWVDSPPHFVKVGQTEVHNDYRLSKFRYEVVPNLWSVAILYEPNKLNGRTPAILNLIGHEPPMGEAAEYEQKRCINFAKRGMIALSLGWIGFGELDQPENAHDYAAALDLVGSNALGLFYLSMRRGLDYLARLPDVDPTRIGVTGLSGGGWQTVILSAMDERVAASVEVAGIGSLQSNITHPVDTDEVEENATDLNQGQDYPFFVAMRAPKPTLLIHNAEDDCCFRAALVKPYIYDRVKPFFTLYGKPDALAWFENTDPGIHNYGLDSREEAYKFFDKNFGISASPNEIPSSRDIKTSQELTVGLPSTNLTILGLARQFETTLSHPAIPKGINARKAWVSSHREKLKSIIRYAPVSVRSVWRMSNTRQLGVRTLSCRFDFTNRLSAAGVWLQGIATPDDAPVTIVLNDKGYKAAAEDIAWHVNRGERVLALDLMFTGSMRPQVPDPTDWELLVSTTGGRPLGLEAAQLLAVQRWARDFTGQANINVVSNGIRTEVIALIAAAIQSDAFPTITSHHSVKSLGYLLSNPVHFRSAPDLFCLDLYKYFDLSIIAAMAEPTTFLPD
jgi:hypothetical protein